MEQEFSRVCVRVCVNTARGDVGAVNLLNWQMCLNVYVQSPGAEATVTVVVHMMHVEII